MISENRKEIIDAMLTKEQKQFMKQMKNDVESERELMKLIKAHPEHIDRQ